MRERDKSSTLGLGLLSIMVMFLGCERSNSENAPPLRNQIDKTSRLTGVCEIACGQCLFEMKGSGCDLAIRWQGRAMFVDGSGIDDHGDAHGNDGLCNMIRMGDVDGEVRDGRFQCDSMELRPIESGE